MTIVCFWEDISGLNIVMSIIDSRVFLISPQNRIIPHINMLTDLNSKHIF